MRLSLSLIACSLCAIGMGQKVTTYPRTAELEQEFGARQNDWRNGAVVYQVFVDRFAPSANLEAKKSLYAAPRTLHPWSEDPKPGVNLPKAGVWSHEIAFWGGDLKSTRSKLDYVQSLGADVLYLNPIVKAFTNHKYDALDYQEVSPEYGTRQDVKELASDLHTRGMKLMLDGVFNHQGFQSPRFQEALHNPQSAFRNWFYFGPQYHLGYRAWADVANLPDNNLENPAVRDYLWNKPDSVVQSYLKEGVDGWRLDVAYDLGFDYLHELTSAAHRAKPGSAVVGEIWNYPELWSPAVDGVMNFNLRQEIFGIVHGEISPRRAALDLDKMQQDCGILPLLKAWIVLDNHDTDRLRSSIPDDAQRHMAQLLQFTLPGCPCIYYGSEVGMVGAGDPGSRGPMRWEMATDSNPEYNWTKKMLALRKQNRALGLGNLRLLDSEKLLAFSRTTDKVKESLFVFCNPSGESVKDLVLSRESRIANWSRLKDLVDGAEFHMSSGFIEVTVPAHGFRILRLDDSHPGGEYTPYKRIP